MTNNSLDRFKNAQIDNYPIALREMQNGLKRSHWIWFIFPQLRGLGNSENSRYYGIAGEEEARLYLADEVLGARLKEITAVLLDLEDNDPVRVMGGIDAMKLRSCMTLFAYISDEGSVFHRVLDKFFGGIQDGLTLRILREARP